VEQSFRSFKARDANQSSSAIKAVEEGWGLSEVSTLKR
jgi:hypothetical protein